MPERTFLTSPEKLPNLQETQYTVTRSPLFDPGLIPVPGLGPEGTPTIFVRVRAPVEMEVISWVASCEAGPPTVPSPFGPGCPFGLNENRVLLSVQIGAIVPTPIGGGTAGHGWSISGVYVYGKVQPEGITNIPLGVVPWEQSKIPTFPNYFPASNFIQGILDPKYPHPLFPLPTPTQSGVQVGP